MFDCQDDISHILSLFRTQKSRSFISLIRLTTDVQEEDEIVLFSPKREKAILHPQMRE